MKRYSIIILFIVETVTAMVNGQNLMRYQSLEGQWKFSIGDDMKWAQPDYDDTDWESIYVPKAWEDQGFNGYDGYAWYRKEVTISSDLKNEVLWLELGYVDDVDELYINGQRVGKNGTFPPDFQTAYNARRLYRIPSNVLTYGEKNLIAVRVYDAYNVGGIFSGNVGLRKERNPLALDLDLEGEWQFNTGDYPGYATVDFDDRHWSAILVPGAWEDQGFRYYDGIAWYRRTIELPDHLRQQQLILMLGKIDDVDEVYFNGELIGQTGELPVDYFRYNDAYKAQRGYAIPMHLLQKVNTIAVRVYDDRLTGGIYEGPVGIITQEKYIRYWKQRKNQ